MDGPNLYTYVRQNPWTFFDPTGLESYETNDDQTHGDQLETLGLDVDQPIATKRTTIQGEVVVTYQQGDQVRYGWQRTKTVDGQTVDAGTIWSDNFDEFFGHFEYGIPWTANAKEGNLQALAGIIPAPEAVRAGKTPFQMVQSARAAREASRGVLRQNYNKEVGKLKAIGQQMLGRGMSESDVAQQLHGMRRALGTKFKGMTPSDLLEYIHKFNVDRYGDKLGPTYDFLTKVQGKTPAQIINSASRTAGDLKQLGAALHKHFGDEIAPVLHKYKMFPHQ